jgi:hypothetical protein
MTYELVALVGSATVIFFGTGLNYDIEIFVREKLLSD